LFKTGHNFTHSLFRVRRNIRWFAVNVDTLVRPFVETGGIIALKTGTIDSRIKQDESKIGTMERQLAAKEAELKLQYARMESAYSRMEQMSNSLDNFSQQNRNR
jgi:flagellar hook-associated protein 2